MYEIKNGFLHRNGKRIFALGESYYPSFHPSKFPVPPEGDRMGEMKKDLRMMAEAGFNHVRFAALGDAELGEDGKVNVKAPFIDEMIKEAEKNGLSVSVREQGFSVNLRGFENVDMIDENGNHPDYAWHDFVRSTLFHDGILEDNFAHASALSKHFSSFPAVVAFQIYNEPKYPNVGRRVFDYHPLTIKAYRRWLVEHNVLSESEAESYEPPHSRTEQSNRMWALWRIFSRDAMSAFLANAATGSRDGSSIPLFTCLTATAISTLNAYATVDVFAAAEHMDICGYTVYVHAWGSNYPVFCLQADLEQCAAELHGKQSWCIELDSRTFIPPSVYNRGTLGTLGSGCKGIVFYQWRGDCPVPGVPFANSCGILNYDGTKTANFDNAVRVNAYIESMSELLLGAERLHEGIGLLHSDYAAFMSDAENNVKAGVDNPYPGNPYVSQYTEIHKRLREMGYNVSLTDAEHLKKNPLGLKLLLMPAREMLSPEELSEIRALRDTGVRIFEWGYSEGYTAALGFKEFRDERLVYPEVVFDPHLTLFDIADLTEIFPAVSSMDPRIGVQTLTGDGYHLIVVTSISAVLDNLSASLRVLLPYSSAEFYPIDGKGTLKATGEILTLSGIGDGGIVVLR